MAYYPGNGYYMDPAQQQALRMDAADGRIDGQYYGARIAATQGAAAAMDASDGRMDGRVYGQPVVSATPYQY